VPASAKEIPGLQYLPVPDKKQEVKKHDPQRQVTVLDTIIAVVNDNVITRQELINRLRVVISQLQKQGTPLPPLEVLEKQIVDAMITDMLQEQYGRENGVRVDEMQLDQAILRLAQQSNLQTLTEFRAKLEADGVDYKKFREEVRYELISSRLREREVESKLIISDAEVDAYLATMNKMGMVNEEYHLAHILMSVPEQANPAEIQEAHSRAEKALALIDGGTDFAQVAASMSDAQDALKGGDLGWRNEEGVPPLFLEAVQSLGAGQVSRVMRSPSGFHIVKMIEKRTGEAPVMITQTHARHILIKTSEIVSSAEARQRIMEIRQRIEEGGADFAEQAKRYSQDGTAQKGGDLDWLSAGQTVPEFDDAMNRLRPNEVGMVQTQFGWHLVQVLERRQTDVSKQQERQQARVAIAAFKSDERFNDWLRQLRDNAYIEYRPDPYR